MGKSEKGLMVSAVTALVAALLSIAQGQLSKPTVDAVNLENRLTKIETKVDQLLERKR